MKLDRSVLVFVIVLCGIQLCEAEPPQGDTPSLQPEPSGIPPWHPIGKYIHPPIRESSGVVKSRQFQGVYWTLNDSGNPPILYATTLEGELIREFPVEGTTNRDWEALEVDDKGQLWVGEIGNNSRMRDDLTIYVVPEPDPFKDSEARTIAQYPYRYPDENVDAEGLFVADGVPYIVSKERDRAILYRFTALQPGAIHVVEQVGELVDARLVTGADLSSDGNRLVVCTYDALWVYHGEANDIPQLISKRPWTLTHGIGGEAVGFDGMDVVLTTERRDIYRIPQWWYEGELSLPPRDIRSAFSLLPTTRTQGAELQTESYQEAGIDIGGGHVVLAATQPGAKVSQFIEVPYADQYKLSAVLTYGPEYAQVALIVNGKPVGEPYNCYRTNAVAGSFVTFGTTALKAGENEITLQVTGKSPKAQGYKVGIDSYLVRPNSRFAPRYLVLGPFPKAHPETIDEALPPEVNLDLKGTFQGIGGRPIRWQEAEARGDGLLDLRVSTGVTQAKEVVAYTLTYVYSEADREATLLVGSNDQIAVWVNRKEVHRHNISRWAVPDQDAAPCQLKAGWNTVLCKIGQNDGGWVLFLRFTDPDGSLKYTIQPPGE